MYKPLVANNERGHVVDYMLFHPVVLDWFEGEKLRHPEARDLAVACDIAVGCADHRLKDVGFAYQFLRSMVESWNRHGKDPVKVMSRPNFVDLVESLQQHAGFRQSVGKVLLMREPGQVGDYRQHLFETGFREPLLSAIMCERFPHLNV